jgi:hypothetical protein
MYHQNQYSILCHYLMQLSITQIDEYTKGQKPIWQTYVP